MTCPKKGCGAKMCYLCKEPVQVETFDIDHRGGGDEKLDLCRLAFLEFF